MTKAPVFTTLLLVAGVGMDLSSMETSSKVFCVSKLKQVTDHSVTKFDDSLEVEHPGVACSRYCLKNKIKK